MRSKGVLFAIAAGVAAVSPAMADDVLPPTGYRQISQGDLPGAIRLLEAQRAAHPEMPELMLNLAAAYLRSGRPDEARALYRTALAVPSVNMDMPSGKVVASHAVAERGLRILNAQIASR